MLAWKYIMYLYETFGNIQFFFLLYFVNNVESSIFWDRSFSLNRIYIGYILYTLDT